MRIAIDVRSLMEGRHSGVEEYTIQIIRGMLRIAPQNEYHMFCNSARSPRLPDFGSQARVHSFRYPNKLFNASQWAFWWPRWDRLVKDSIDVVFVPSFRLLPLSPQVPIVTTVHDLSFERFPEFLDWRRRLWHRLMRPRQLAHNSDHLIAVSNHTKQDLVDLYGVEEEKISVIYSGVSVSERAILSDQVKNVRVKYSLPDRFVLYFGVLEPRKNIPSIIRAYSAIADSVAQDLVIAGRRGWLTGEMNRAVRESSVRQRIHFPGFIEGTDREALYAASDLFVYPSFYEGFGFPPLEALSVGTPVITSFNSSLPEVVGEWATLTDPHNVSELALVMRELLNDLPVVAEETSSLIRERYSWDRAARLTLETIARAI